MWHGDTIVALSTGSLPSGVAILRISGPQAGPMLLGAAGTLPPPRQLTLAHLALGSEVIDRGLVAWFPSPHSFTGEDVAELHVHGSPAGVKALLSGLTALPGTRLAAAGEFTRRAFENGKLDLTEVEGLGDLLDAETEQQRRQALRRLDGRLSQQIARWRNRLLDLRARIEAQLDFSDEGDVGDLPPSFADETLALAHELRAEAVDAARGQITREGARIVLSGAPNAGKSSLLNALAKADLAIVSDEPGTTRDVREVQLDLGGHLAIVVDTAGIREASGAAEIEGIRRAQQELARADLILLLEAPDAPTIEVETPSTSLWRIGTKADLATREGMDVHVSATSGEGLPLLYHRLSEFVASLAGQEPALVSRERDRVALEVSAAAAERAANSLGQPELAAEDLRAASASLERLIGRIDSELVLDRLFQSFCIGK